MLYAKKLLERRGPGMGKRKLDSVLEMHLKSRGHMRSEQINEEIAEYSKVLAIHKLPDSMHRRTK